jgi:hypothetical protein
MDTLDVGMTTEAQPSGRPLSYTIRPILSVKKMLHGAGERRGAKETGRTVRMPAPSAADHAAVQVEVERSRSARSERFRPHPETRDHRTGHIGAACPAWRAPPGPPEPRPTASRIEAPQAPRSCPPLGPPRIRSGSSAAQLVRSCPISLQSDSTLLVGRRAFA